METATRYLHLPIQGCSLTRTLKREGVVRLVAQLKVVEHFQNTNGGLVFLLFVALVACPITSVSCIEKRHETYHIALTLY